MSIERYERMLFEYDAKHGEPVAFFTYWMQRLKWPALIELLSMHDDWLMQYPERMEYDLYTS